MLRLVVLNLFLFLLPVIAGWIWTNWISRRAPSADIQKYYAKLFFVGALLVIVSLMSLRFMQADIATDKSYIAPQYKDGEIIPGHFE